VPTLAQKSGVFDDTIGSSRPVMYESREPLTRGRETQDLEQGDVLRGVLTPEAVTGASFGIRRGGSWDWQRPQLPAEKILEEEAKGPKNNLRVMAGVARGLDCIVLSNSCDNNSGDSTILLAPIHPFELEVPPVEEMRERLAAVLEVLAPRCSRAACEGFAFKTASGAPLCDQCAESESTAEDLLHAGIVRSALAIASTPSDRALRLQADGWLQVSRLATGHSKSFYMPGSPPSEFRRSEVDLSEMFAVEPSFLARCLAELNARRLFGLAPEAARHLQRTLDFFFGRHPRGDHAWPSREDLELKLVWLDGEVRRGGRRLDEYVKERDAIREFLAKNSDPW
jgi:hypothetical protein